MKKNYGILIIEVKDCEPHHYYISDDKWYYRDNVRSKEYLIKSPIEQVQFYKNELYSLHIPTLLQKNIKNSKFYSVVGCAVYFHKFQQHLINCDNRHVSLLFKGDLSINVFDGVLAKYHMHSLKCQL